MQKRELPGGTKLLIVDDLAPEDLAMLQALYSRSADSAEDHLIKVKRAGSGKFMSNFYVGYNHKSIADCGTTTFFIEGVSTLAAKAIQDWPLYSGQETSTRYIDMSRQRIVDPVNSVESRTILNEWMSFYTSSQERVAATVRSRYPRREGEKEDVYERAVKARSFDILRGFLPAGITTQLSWHTNLRQAADHLNLLAKHPLSEVSNLASNLRDMFGSYYPSSGAVNAAGVSAVVGNAEQRDHWEHEVVYGYSYTSRNYGSTDRDARAGLVRLSSSISSTEIEMHAETLASRPRGSVLPHFMSDFGQLSFLFDLDFGSFRDIQRHRNGVCRMPLLTTDHGFEPWYLGELDERLGRDARNLIRDNTDRIDDLECSPVEKQNYIPLGFRVPCRVTYALPAAVYVLELRSSKTVHPTLRRVVHKMVAEFQKHVTGVPLHVDMDADDWTVRRGAQTIEARP